MEGLNNPDQNMENMGAGSIEKGLLDLAFSEEEEEASGESKSSLR